MFKTKKSTLDRAADLLPQLTDLLPQQKKSHTKAKLAGVGLASIAMAAVAGALSKDHDH